MVVMVAVREKTFREKRNDKLKLDVGQPGRPLCFGSINTQVRILPSRNYRFCRALDKSIYSDIIQDLC